MSRESRPSQKKAPLLESSLSVAALQALLAKGADINDNNMGENALYAITLVPCLFQKKLLILLEAGIDVNSKELLSKYQNTPLHVLISQEDHVNAIFFIEHAANKLNFTITDSEGKTTLIFSAKINSTVISLALIKKIGRNPAILNQQDANGMSALHYACLYGNIFVAKALIAAGASTTLLNKEQKAPIDCSVLGENKIKEALLAVEIDPARDEKARYNHFGNKYGEPLIYGMTQLPAFVSTTLANKLVLLEVLKKPLIDTMLMGQGKIGLMSKEEKKQIELQANTLTGKALSASLAESASSLKEYLIGNGHYSDFLLRSEAAVGNLPSIQRLLVHPSLRVNQPGMPSGRTALHQAALNNHLDICMLLIDAGANLALQDSQGNTALHLALQKGHFSLAETLVLKGADITIANKKGETAISFLDGKKMYELKEKLCNLTPSFSQEPSSSSERPRP